MQHFDTQSKHRTDEISYFLNVFCIPLSGIDLIDLQHFQGLKKNKSMLRKLAHWDEKWLPFLSANQMLIESLLARYLFTIYN